MHRWSEFHIVLRPTPIYLYWSLSILMAIKMPLLLSAPCHAFQPLQVMLAKSLPYLSIFIRRIIQHYYRPAILLLVASMITSPASDSRTLAFLNHVITTWETWPGSLQRKHSRSRHSVWWWLPRQNKQVIFYSMWQFLAICPFSPHR